MVITKKILIIPLTLKAYFNLHKLYYLSKNSQNFWPGLLKPPTMNNLWKYLISRFLIFFSLFQHSINSALPISFFFLGAFLNHQLIGTSFLIFTKNKEIAELGICVIDEFQNKGIGTKLINHLILHAKHMGINKLYLTVSPYNLIAIHLYKKFGFTYIAKSKEILMQLDLKHSKISTISNL